MEFLPIIAAILFVDFLAHISPGPNFVLTTSAAVSKSRRHAVWTACGVAMGSLAWAGAAALGIASVFEALPLLGFMLKVLGIAYLIYLGIKLLCSKGFQPNANQTTDATSGARGFWRGLLVNMTNPKSAAYYASVFAAFLTPDMPIWVLVLLVAAISAMSLSSHVLIAISFSASRVQTRYISVSKYVDQLCGGILIFLGLRLAWDSR
ncbi:LysE family transporter [uncultured Roseobacter sp.]|uniref:LysE family translocator n=1 Tax=uncultured Roseobacter sp. TaxID=114847 RepID=UPI00260DEF9E|nr:LysE family transporter [uncultured Roseobacter sp.]